MVPALSVRNLPRTLQGDIKAFCNLVVGVTLRAKETNLLDIASGECRFKMALTARSCFGMYACSILIAAGLPLFGNHVFDVVCMGAKKQMVRVNAERHVAFMENVELARIHSVSQFVDYSADSERSDSRQFDQSVALVTDLPGPKMASGIRFWRNPLHDSLNLNRATIWNRSKRHHIAMISLESQSRETNY